IIDTYRWTNNRNAFVEVKPEFTQTITEDITYYITTTTKNGCTASDSVSITYNRSESILWPMDTLVCGNTTVSLHTELNPGVSLVGYTQCYYRPDGSYRALEKVGAPINIQVDSSMQIKLKLFNAIEGSCEPQATLRVSKVEIADQYICNYDCAEVYPRLEDGDSLISGSWHYLDTLSYGKCDTVYMDMSYDSIVKRFTYDTLYTTKQIHSEYTYLYTRPIKAIDTLTFINDKNDTCLRIFTDPRLETETIAASDTHHIYKQVLIYGTQREECPESGGGEEITYTKVCDSVFRIEWITDPDFDYDDPNIDWDNLPEHFDEILIRQHIETMLSCRQIPASCLVTYSTRPEGNLEYVTAHPQGECADLPSSAPRPAPRFASRPPQYAQAHNLVNCVEISVIDSIRQVPDFVNGGTKIDTLWRIKYKCDTLYLSNIPGYENYECTTTGSSHLDSLVYYRIVQVPDYINGGTKPENTRFVEYFRDSSTHTTCYITTFTIQAIPNDTSLHISQIDTLIFCDTTHLYHIGDSSTMIHCTQQSATTRISYIDKDSLVQYHTLTYEYVIDTAHVVFSGRTRTGCSFTDTFAIIRVPMYFDHIRDTFVANRDTAILWTQSTDPDHAVSFKWEHHKAILAGLDMENPQF
ncbi:MAG: hypothetical protein RR190_00220, partial [Bacteroidales bacterium]